MSADTLKRDGIRPSERAPSGQLADTSTTLWSRRGTWGTVLAVSVAALLLCWTRVANLGTSFWNDEAYTALKYADAGPGAIFRGAAYVPNNHVLFSLATWATTNVLGRSEAAYRIWSVVPGLAAVALVAWWARRFFDSITAVAVLVLATVSEVHLQLVPQARGYGLAMLAGAGILIGAVRADQLQRRDGLAIFALSGLVGICTLPVFVLAFISQGAVLLARRELRRATIATCALVGLASAIFYAPLLRGVLDQSDQEFGVRLRWYGFLTGPYRHLAEPTVRNLLPQLSSSLFTDVMVLLVTGVLVVLGVSRLLRRDPRLCLHLLVPVGGTYLILVVTRLYVAPRFTSFLLFHVLLVLAVGVSAVWHEASKQRIGLALVIAAASIGLFVGGRHIVTETRRQASEPWENFKAVRDIATSTHIDRVYSSGPPPWSLKYYVASKRLTPLSDDALQSRQYCRLPRPYILVAPRKEVQGHRWGKVLPDANCLRQTGAMEIRPLQQSEPHLGSRAPIDLWVAPAEHQTPPHS